jgi:hypothetical protein
VAGKFTIKIPYYIWLENYVVGNSKHLIHKSFIIRITKKSVKIINEYKKNNDDKRKLTKISYFQITTNVRSKYHFDIRYCYLFYLPAWLDQRSKISREQSELSTFNKPNLVTKIDPRYNLV